MHSFVYTEPCKTKSLSSVNKKTLLCLIAFPRLNVCVCNRDVHNSWRQGFKSMDTRLAFLWDHWQEHPEAAIHPKQRCQDPDEGPEI